MALLDDLGPIIANAVDIVLRDLTVIKETDTYDPASGQEIGKSVSYTCRGVVVDYSLLERAAMRVADNERRLLITRQSLAVEPKLGDTVSYDGRVYTINRLAIDPAKAMWDLTVS